MSVLNKVIVSIFFLLIFTIPVIAEEYSVSMTHVDRFICRDSPSQINYENITENVIFNETSIKVFDNTFREQIKIWNEFNFIRGCDQNGCYHEVFYFLEDDYFKYRVETDGNVYFIGAEPIKNITTNELLTYWETFGTKIRRIRYSLRDAIEETTQLNCDPGSDLNRDLLGILNLYGPFIDKLNCKITDGSINIDCSNDKFVNSIISNMWSKVTYHDRRSYILGNNRIFVDLNEFGFNRENRYDVMFRPLIVFSESKFANSLGSGQTDYVHHVEFLQDLEKLPILIQRLKKNRIEVENESNQMQKDIISLKNLWLNNKGDTVIDQIESLDDKYKNEVADMELFGIAESFFSELSKDLDGNTREYFKDIHKNHLKNYLSDLNTELFLFRNSYEALEQKKEFYHTFTTSINSDINNQKNTNYSLKIASWAIFVTIGLFIFNLYLNSKFHWENQISSLKTILDNLNEIAKRSEDYKIKFIRGNLKKTIGSEENLKKIILKYFNNYASLFNKNKKNNELNKDIDKILNKDYFVNYRIHGFLKEIYDHFKLIEISKKPEYLFKQIYNEQDLKNIDYEISFLNFFKKYDSLELKRSINRLTYLLEILNYQIKDFLKEKNTIKFYGNILNLDKKIYVVFRCLIKNKEIRLYWEKNKKEMQTLNAIIRRIEYLNEQSSESVTFPKTI